MKQLHRKLIIFLILVVLLALIFGASRLNPRSSTPQRGQVPENKQGGTQDKSPLFEVVAQNLDVPWSLDFLPGGGLIFTERAGKVKVIEKTGDSPKTILTLLQIAQIGESGLLGLALHPNFGQNSYVYLYYTYLKTEGSLVNKVVRYKKVSDNLVEDKIILDNIPASQNHDGGRLKFGPDGYLYITTGDAQNPQNSQNKNSVAGKILRLKDDGSVPSDNPFPASGVYSFGHRNPQGLAWDARGNLWATEHGPSAKDELNLIAKGKNYGWPTITGDGRQDALETPILNSGLDTWAPSGMTFSNGYLYFVGLRGQSLYRVHVATDQPTLKSYFKNQFGRLREVSLGPDGMLYILTNNRDGRGKPTMEDDRIIRVNPALPE